MTSPAVDAAQAAGMSGAPALLRIAILGTRGIPARYGGFETFAERLAVGLVQRGHQVTVYAESEGPPGPDAWHEGVRVRARRRPAWGPASVLAYDGACLWDARHGFDLVYMLGYGAAWACWLPRAAGTPVWINVDGLEWARSKWGRGARSYLRAMEAVASRTATRLIADAEAIAQRFRQHYPGGARCDFIAYGADEVQPGDADARLLAPWGLAPGCYHVVVARAEPENHLLEIIEGHCLHLQQHADGWPLVIVGDVSGATPYQQQLRALASERVLFTGGIYVPAQLNALRVFAASYLHGHSVGGTNPSLLESLACGNWVVAHDNPFNREVARDAADYFSGPAQLADRLNQRLAQPPEAVAQRAARARQIIAQHYTWPAIVDAYEVLMRAEVAQKRQKARR